jgi:hypothetical protein
MAGNGVQVRRIPEVTFASIERIEAEKRCEAELRRCIFETLQLNSEASRLPF